MEKIAVVKYQGKIDIRFAEHKDRNELMKLWKICFHDTQTFINFFFTNRFFPEYSVCAICDGHVVSAMHSMPLALRIRGQIVPGAIISGVSTHPDFRGIGLMKAIFHYYLHEIHRFGIHAVTYKPENYQVYASLSHDPVTEALRYETVDSHAAKAVLESIRRVSGTPSDKDPFTSESMSLSKTALPHVLECFDLYCRISGRYSGIIERTLNDFRLKFSDYQASKARCIRVYRNKSLSAYGCFFITNETLTGEELIALSGEAMMFLVHSLHRLARGRKISLKLPPDFTSLIPVDPNGSYRAYLSAQNLAGAVDLSSLIHGLNLSRIASPSVLSGLVFSVSDPVLERNCGPIDLMGDKTSLPPAVSLPIGSFLQFLFGFRSLKEISAQENPLINILSKEKLTTADKLFPTQCCYAADEY